MKTFSDTGIQSPTIHSSLFKSASGDIYQLRRYLLAKLNDPESKIFRALRTLSDEDKVKIANAMINKNYGELQSLLEKTDLMKALLTRTGFKKETIKDFFAAYEITGGNGDIFKDNNFTVNNFEKALFDCMFPTEPVAEVARSAILIGRAFTDLPVEEGLYSHNQKMRYVAAISPAIAGRVKKFYKNDTLSAVSKSVSDKMTLEQYKSAVKSADTCEWILLSLELLKSAVPHHDEYDAIHRGFLHGNYNECVSSIEELARKMNNSSISESILNHGPLKIETERNYSRRFFENQFSRFHAGLDTNQSAAMRFCDFYLGVHGESLRDLEDMTMQLAKASILKVKGYFDYFLNTSQDYKNRGRAFKPGMISREDQFERGIKGESVLSGARGVATSVMPVYPDMVSEKPETNRIADIYFHKRDNDSRYAVVHPQTALVGGVSTHGFYIMALMVNYLHENTGRQEAKAEALAFLQHFTTMSMRYGFHSYLEIMDAATDPNVKKSLQPFDIDLQRDFKWEPKILEHSLHDAAIYAREQCLRKGVQQEIKALDTENASKLAPK